MDCIEVKNTLVPYHFATCSDEERDGVDGHLVGCTECLRAYLALKRAVERGAGVEEAPSAATRARLRASVAAEFSPSAPARFTRWLRRPIPLYQGLAAAAVAILVASLLPELVRGPRPLREGAFVDTARTTAESLTIY
jgi:hypothetical protein